MTEAADQRDRKAIFAAAASGLVDLVARTAALARDIALPTLCLSCREPVAGEGVCAACWSAMNFLAPPWCERLGTPFAQEGPPGLISPEAIADPPAFDRARAVLRYEEAAAQLVHGFKYQDRTDLAPTMARWMMRAGHELLADAELLVPVPLHWRRSFSRRFNQSGVLANFISRASGVPLGAVVLARSRRTRPQVGLTRSERSRNVQGAFRVPDGQRARIHGRRVLLIDDVLTSGATLDACARTLLRGGAAAVDVLVFARVVDGRTAPI